MKTIEFSFTSRHWSINEDGFLYVVVTTSNEMVTKCSYMIPRAEACDILDISQTKTLEDISESEALTLVKGIVRGEWGLRLNFSRLVF